MYTSQSMEERGNMPCITTNRNNTNDKCNKCDSNGLYTHVYIKLYM